MKTEKAKVDRILKVLQEIGYCVTGISEIEDVLVFITRKPEEPTAAPGRVAPTEEPTIAQMLSNFAEAMKDWAKAGFKLVDQTEFTRRLNICRSCPLWMEDARKGLGKCKHSKCGCTKIKHWLASSKCPQGRWEKGK